ncbi:MAG: hypothetical protein JWP81_1631 [Ferruginibacter sp.]|nr:hypothetical protein [Ferruginibacter sp.]
MDYPLTGSPVKAMLLDSKYQNRHINCAANGSAQNRNT